MDLSKLSLSDKIIAGTGIVLFLTLFLFPWHSIDTGFGTFTRSGIESPNSFWGLLALLLTIAVVVVTLLRALSPSTNLPDLPISWNRAIFFGSAAVAVLLLLKLLMETTALGFGAYLAIVLAGGMTYGGFLKFQEDAKGTTGSTPPPPAA